MIYCRHLDEAGLTALAEQLTTESFEPRQEIIADRGQCEIHHIYLCRKRQKRPGNRSFRSILGENYLF